MEGDGVSESGREEEEVGRSGYPKSRRRGTGGRGIRRGDGRRKRERGGTSREWTG